MAGAAGRNGCLLDIWKVETKELHIEHLLRAGQYARFYKAVVPNFWISQKLKIYMYFMGEGNGTPLQYCCPENPMDGGAW